MIVPDPLTFSANTAATYNVIEAACKLGVKKIIIASSETTYGVCFTQGEKGNDYKEMPLLESYDIDPMVSKPSLARFPFYRCGLLICTCDIVRTPTDSPNKSVNSPPNPSPVVSPKPTLPPPPPPTPNTQEQTSTSSA